MPVKFAFVFIFLIYTADRQLRKSRKFCLRSLIIYLLNKKKNTQNVTCTTFLLILLTLFKSIDFTWFDWFYWFYLILSILLISLILLILLILFTFALLWKIYLRKLRKSYFLFMNNEIHTLIICLNAKY